MKKQNLVMLILVLALTGASAAMLARLKSHQKLGQPGIRTTPIPGSVQVRVDLPEKVLDYDSQELEQPAIVTNTLPKDTSYGQRLYRAPDGFWVRLNVVMMGTDRTSLHKPEFCLVGAGWRIDSSEELTIPMAQPHPYQLPVVRKLLTGRTIENGQPVTYRGIYVYWYVADQAVSGGAAGWQRMWWMAKELLRTGVLQRWAYVTCFAICRPGEEEATYARVRQFIQAAIPQFQLAAGRAEGAATEGSPVKP
jgi:hypothetical protein